MYISKYMYDIITFYSCYLIGNFLKNKHECKGLKGDEKLKVESLLLFFRRNETKTKGGKRSMRRENWRKRCKQSYGSRKEEEMENSLLVNR